MRLSKKLTAIFTPIASISIIAPIATSCGSKTFEIEFGDSVNCAFSKKKEFTQYAPYKKRNAIYHAAESLANQEPGKPITVGEVQDAKTLKSVYADFVASASKVDDNRFFIRCNNASESSFASFTFYYYENDEVKEVPEESTSETNFIYEKGSDSHLVIYFRNQAGTESPKFQSYTYWNCEVTG